MSEKDFKGLLKAHQLKITGPRLKVLDIMAQRSAATSQPMLEKTIGDSIDRVTLYRVLSTFEEKGIIHKVFDLNGTATYAFCSSTCDEHHHRDQHLHFMCTNCNSVYCLSKVELPPLSLPPGFGIEQWSVNASGICARCQAGS